MFLVSGVCISGYKYDFQSAFKLVHSFLQIKSIHTRHTQIQNQYTRHAIDSYRVEKMLSR